MLVATVTGVLGLLVVLLAYYRDDTEVTYGLQPPDWELLPSQTDLSRVEFPLTVPGYDPATVELYFEVLARAYGDLLAVAPPEVVERARHRVAARRGVEPDAAPHSASPVGPAAASALGPAAEVDADEEALRTEAALAALDLAAEQSTSWRDAP